MIKHRLAYETSTKYGGNNFLASTAVGKLMGALALVAWLMLGSAFSGQAQNAIVGAGFAPGWGGACGTNTDFQYFGPSLGSSWIRTTTANGDGNQFFRLGVDWDGQLRQHTITPGQDVAVVPNTEYTLNANCTTDGAMFINVANATDNYIFKTFNATATPAFRMVVFRVQGAVRSISSVSVPTAQAGLPTAITATLDGALAAGQGVYLRYSLDAFATSTVVAMEGSGTEYTANIPALLAGNQVRYYCFTSGNGLGSTLNHNLADFYTINANTNEGLNYSFTVAAAPQLATIAAGNWTNPATWEGGLIPNSPEALALVKHAVTLGNANISVKNLTIENAGSLNLGTGQLAIANEGMVDVSGGFTAADGLLRFTGNGQITKPIELGNTELGGLVDLGGSTIAFRLTLVSGNGTVGSVAAANPPVYATGSTLRISTGTTTANGAEFTTTLLPHNLWVDAGSTYTICSTLATAAYTLPGGILLSDDGKLVLDPLCNGNTAQDPAALQTVYFLTVNGDVTIETGSTLEMQTGDRGSLTEGTRFLMRIRGHLNNAGLLQLNNDIGDDLELQGDFTNTGSFIPGGNVSSGENPITQNDGRAVFFNGTTQQVISGNTTNFHYLILNNPAGILANTGIIVSRGLGLENGKINMNTNTLNIGTFYSNGGEVYILGRLYSSSANAYVYGGPVTRFISNKTQPAADDEQVAPNLGSPIVFPVGSATQYRPFTLTYSAFPASAGTITVKHEAGANIVTGAAPDITDTDGLQITELYTDAYWNVGVNAATGGTFNVVYTCTNCAIGNGDLDKIRAIRRTDAAGTWTAPGGIIATSGSNQSPTVGRSGLSAFSQFGIGYDPIVLPVSLVSFTGTATAAGNLLQWSSNGEVAFSHYLLQRSADGQQWQHLARINGQGAQQGLQQYAHTDAKASGLQHYRLQMVDKDGSSSFSKVVVLNNTATTSQQFQVIYAGHERRIVLQQSGSIFATGSTARLIDINGRVLLQQKLTAQPNQSIEVSNLAPGIYFVQCLTVNGMVSEKILVQ